MVYRRISLGEGLLYTIYTIGLSLEPFLGTIFPSGSPLWLPYVRYPFDQMNDEPYRWSQDESHRYSILRSQKHNSACLGTKEKVD